MEAEESGREIEEVKPILESAHAISTIPENCREMP
jgi:hypothetical protein